MPSAPPEQLLCGPYDVANCHLYPCQGVQQPCTPCVAGLDAPPASPADVAKYTVRTCLRTVPPAVPGIHFLRYTVARE